MPTSEAQKKASEKWESNRDRIVIKPDKETGAKIRAEALKAGKSVTQYILDAIKKYMD